MISLTFDSEGSKSSECILKQFNRNPIHSQNGRIALKSMTMWNGWHNIDKKFDNNVLRFRNEAISMEWRDLVIHDGNYQIKDLYKFLKQHVENEIEIPWTFGAFEAASRVMLKIKKGCQIDFSHGNLNKLLGFESKIYDSGTYIAPNRANISNDIDIIQVHCSVVHGAIYNERLSDIIYSFTPFQPPGFAMHIHESTPVFHSLRDQEITNIEMTITDQNGNQIDLNNTKVHYILLLD